MATWKAALAESPPPMDPCDYGWEPDQQGVMIPRTIPTGTDLASAFILKLIRCTCKTSGCQTATCSCSKIGCTIFCPCGGGKSCRNPLTHTHDQSDEEESNAEIANEEIANEE